MKFFFAVCLAVVVVALASESAVMDENIELIQESASVAMEAKVGAKVGAKVANAEAAKVGSKTGAKAGTKIKERATVTIGTHELDAAKVSMARKRLRKITLKLGARHPIFLGETAGVADFASDDARYVKGGYLKLKSILKKIDEFEGDLFLERQKKINEREYTLDEFKTTTKTFDDETALYNKNNDENFLKQAVQKTTIDAHHATIRSDLTNEEGKATELRTDLAIVDTKYTDHWAAAEDRHAVRNVLMQALWLVCTGFASFRHTTYCSNIRQQPDYDEPTTDASIMETNNVPTSPASVGVGKSIAEQKAKSDKFGETMQPVWEQQKLADAEETNQVDGDVDMEKGFVNNKAPWGVDPEGMGGRASEELGESNEAQVHSMTSQEMSARLTFLVESSSNMPERISSPLTALIQAFDSDDAAVQGGLVEALVNMDTQEGELQSNEDYDYYTTMIEKRNNMHQNCKTAITKKKHGEAEFETIESINDDMDAARAIEAVAVEDYTASVATYKQERQDTDQSIIEQEAVIQAINEELVNIKRLNSLLRFLVVGDEVSCPTSEGFACVAAEGSCTWRNRGKVDNNDAGGQTGCETETGQDIPCDYTHSLTPGSSGIDETPGRTGYATDTKFCACEYGFAPTQAEEDTERNCAMKMCDGFGRIKYTGNGRMALRFEGSEIQYKAVEGQELEGWVKADKPRTVTEYSTMAVCSGKRHEEHGFCDNGSGECTYCFVSQATQYDPTGLDEAVTIVAGMTPAMVNAGTPVKQVPDAVTESMPYKGSKGKCENWYVYKNPVEWGKESAYKWTFGGDIGAECSDHGTAVLNFMGYYTGECECEHEFYGPACEYQKCQTGDKFYTAKTAAVCYGRGSCTNNPNAPASDGTPGTCQCNSMSAGTHCVERRCPGFTKPAGGAPATGFDGEECGKGLGKCLADPAVDGIYTGRCMCAMGTSCGVEDQDAHCPGACIYNKCQSNCGGSNTDGIDNVGICDRFSGYCMCSPEDIFNGPDCQKPGLGQHEKMAWYTQFDKWGWATCKNGRLLTGIKGDGQQTMDALYNIGTADCKEPYENQLKIERAVEKHRCYHENWWKKFDTRGGKFCRRNYFLAGIFRSHCNSLYCIEMAKCCNVKRSVWIDCKWSNAISADAWGAGMGGLTTSGTASFMVGFFRTKLHTLIGIKHVRECTPIWWGQMVSYKTRFD